MQPFSVSVEAQPSMKQTTVYLWNQSKSSRLENVERRSESGWWRV